MDFFDRISKLSQMGHSVISNLLEMMHAIDLFSNFTNNSHKNMNETESPRIHMDGKEKRHK